MTFSSFANTQNSLLEWAWFAGWPATIMICSILYVVFAFIKSNYMKEGRVDIFSLSLFFVYMLLGTVEILIELPFFAILMTTMISVNKENEDSVK